MRDLHRGHQVASSVAFGDGWRLPGARDVANGVAAVAHEVVVLLADIGVVALRPVNDVDLEELAHRHEFVQRVVHRGPADLGESLPSEVVKLLGGQMHVVADEHLGHNPPLRAEPPVSVP